MRILLLLALATALPASAAEHLRILLTNDDGFESRGIQTLHKALKDAGHDVYLIAPAEQQSGASASVTSRGVQVTEHPDNVWAVHGRPADAVRVGLGSIMLNEPPHLVVSGANFGQNTGLDVNVSGTVGAAMTAWHLGFPAIAISVEIKFDEAERGFPSTAGAFSGAARVLVRLIRNMDLKDMSAMLNVNYPARLPLDVRGVRWSELSDHSVFGLRYQKTPDGFYRPIFQSPHKNARANDAESLIDGFVTLTFLDGNIETPTHRNQRYLDRNLLDRSNRTETKTLSKTPSKISRQPEAEKSAPAENKQKAAKVTQAAPSQPTSQPLSQPPSVEKVSSKPPPVPKPASTIHVRKPASSPIQLPEAQSQQAGQSSPTVDRSQDQTQDEAQDLPTSKTDTGAGEKQKPDSWLRRMFDPGSWRR